MDDNKQPAAKERKRFTKESLAGRSILSKIETLTKTLGVKISDIFESGDSASYQLYKRLRKGEALTQTSMVTLQRFVEAAFQKLSDNGRIWTQEEISASNINALLNYVEEKAGAAGVSEITGSLDLSRFLSVDISDGHLKPVSWYRIKSEPSLWISNRLSLLIYRKAAAVLGGAEELRVAGEYSVLHTDLKFRAAWAAMMMFPSQVIERISQENNNYNRTKLIRVDRLSNNSTQIEVTYRPHISSLDSGEQLIPEICQWNQGLYKGYLELGGADGCEVTESSCFAHGDDSCVFKASWGGQVGLRRRIRKFIRYLQR